MSSKNCHPSPLPYFGGKTRALQILQQHVPSDVNLIVSPFCGGCSFEIHMAHEGFVVLAHDTDPFLLNYWEVQLRHPQALADRIEMLRTEFGKEMFHHLRGILKVFTPLNAAAIFYGVLRSAFNKDFWKGGYSLGHKRFTESSVERVRNFHCPNLLVSLQDYRYTLAGYDRDFLFLDPPYYLNDFVYGEKGIDFPHEDLAQRLRKHKGRFMMTYGDHPYIRSLYEPDFFVTAMEPWRYGASNGKPAQEIIIKNY
jgi:DNA adenine methylase